MTFQEDCDEFNKALTEFKQVIMKELIEPWAEPFVRWLNKIIKFITNKVNNEKLD